MTAYAYKLLNPDLTTHGRCQWEVRIWKETNGKGPLCGPGWLHAYPVKPIALFLNPIHANIPNPVLYQVEVGGKKQEDGGLKVGYTRMRLVRRCLATPPTVEQRVRFAIFCALSVYREPSFRQWAHAWIENTDQSYDAARAAADATVSAAATDAAADAAYAAADAATDAAAADAAYPAADAAAAAAADAAYAAVRAKMKPLTLQRAAQWAMSNKPLPKGLR